LLAAGVGGLAGASAALAGAASAGAASDAEVPPNRESMPSDRALSKLSKAYAMARSVMRRFII